MRQGVFIHYDGDDESLEDIISQKLSKFMKYSKHDEDFINKEQDVDNEYENYFNC